MANRNLRTTVICAPSSANVDAVVNALIRHGVRILNYDLYYPVDSSLPLAETAINRIKEADLVVGILTRERSSQSVLFELGAAAALEKQILIIAPPKLSLPFELQQYTTVRATPTNNEAIEFAIDQVVAVPYRHQSRTTPPANPEPVIGNRSKLFLAQLQEAASDSDFALFEKVFFNVIQSVGLEAMAQARETDPRFDFVIWADELQSALGNPILIELKRNVRDTVAFRDSATKLSHAVRDRGSYFGLYLYWDSMLPDQKLNILSPPNVLPIPIRSLLSDLEHDSFANTILKYRNNRLHGVSY